MKINPNVVMICVTVIIVAALISNISFTQAAPGNDLTIFLSPEDYQILQKQLQFKDGSVSEAVCDQDYCSFTITMNLLDGSQKQELFNIPSSYRATQLDKDGNEEEVELEYTPETFEKARIGLATDYLQSKIISPEKEKEKQKDEYLHTPGGSFVIKEQK